MENIESIFEAFKIEDERIYNDPDMNVENNGHPFTICTNGARWLKENFFPSAIVTGYDTERNPTALIGQETFGHDFLIVDGRYLVDFWYRFLWDKDAPILLDLVTQKDIVLQYYGDPDKWEALKDIED